MARIGLIGSGGQADEVESFFPGEVVFRAVTKEYLGGRALVDVDMPGDMAATPVHIAVGAPGLRKTLTERWQGNEYTTIISDDALVNPDSEIGEGSLVAPRSVITTNVKIGRHVLVNVAATVQHNTAIGDYVTIGPGVNVGGNVTIEEGVFVGIGATISNGVHISEGVVVGAGAVVIDDLKEKNGVYVGVPAKLLRKNEGWINEI
jgi:sugar O-acyltransferase (sialic acid O-acetyltransferase NeuD family)